MIQVHMPIKISSVMYRQYEWCVLPYEYLALISVLFACSIKLNIIVENIFCYRRI